MFEILVHQAPWEDTLDVNDVLRKVAKGERPAIAPSYEAEAKCWCTLMRKCWAQEATDRPAFEEVFAQLSQLQTTTTEMEPRDDGREDSECVRNHLRSEANDLRFNSNDLLTPEPLTQNIARMKMGPTPDSKSEMITHSGNSKLAMELQSVADRQEQRVMDV